jgi:hypothetical protein
MIPDEGLGFLLLAVTYLDAFGAGRDLIHAVFQLRDKLIEVGYTYQLFSHFAFYAAADWG